MGCSIEWVQVDFCILREGNLCYLVLLLAQLFFSSRRHRHPPTSCLCKVDLASTPTTSLSSNSTTSRPSQYTPCFQPYQLKQCETLSHAALSAWQLLRDSKRHELRSYAPTADEQHYTPSLEPQPFLRDTSPPQCDHSKKRARRRPQIKSMRGRKCHKHTTTSSLKPFQMGRPPSHPSPPILRNCGESFSNYRPSRIQISQAPTRSVRPRPRACESTRLTKLCRTP